MAPCELCDNEAIVFCPSDKARLCASCDTKVHSANRIVSRHLRAVLCSSCSQPTMKVITGHSKNITAQCSACLGISPAEEAAAPTILSPTAAPLPDTFFSPRSSLPSACVSPLAFQEQPDESFRDSQTQSSSSSSAAPVALSLFPELPENLHDTSKHLLQPLHAESLCAAEELTSTTVSAEKLAVVPKGHVEEMAAGETYGCHSGSSSPASGSKAGSFVESRGDAAEFPAKKRQRVFKPVAVHGTAKLSSTLLDGVVPCDHPALRQFNDPPHVVQQPQHQQRLPQAASAWHAPFSPFSSLPRNQHVAAQTSPRLQSSATGSFATAAATLGTNTSLPLVPPALTASAKPSSPRQLHPVLPSPPSPTRPQSLHLVPDSVARLQRVLATWHAKLGLHNSHVVSFAFHIFTRVLHRLSLGMVVAEDLRVSLAVCLWIAARAASESGNRGTLEGAAEWSKSCEEESTQRKRSRSSGHPAENKACLRVEDLAAVTRVPVQQLLEGEEVIAELLARSGVAVADGGRTQGGRNESALPVHCEPRSTMAG